MGWGGGGGGGGWGGAVEAGKMDLYFTIFLKI